MPRMLHTGQIIIDLVMALDTLPPSGGDALASSASFHAGGGFNVMAAARRNGLPALYLGRHGQGRFGELARQAMRDEGNQVRALERARERRARLTELASAGGRVIPDAPPKDGGL